MLSCKIEVTEVSSEGHCYCLSYYPVSGNIQLAVQLWDDLVEADTEALRSYFKYPLSPLLSEAIEFTEDYPEVDIHILNKLITELIIYLGI